MERYLLYISVSLILYLPPIIASSGSHSHYFFTTVTTRDPASDYPFYYTSRSIDDITLYRYDSNIGIIERKVPWFRTAYLGLLLASVEEHNTGISQSKVLESFMFHVNDTEGFHVLQLLDGCIAYENGTFDSLLHYHYDGNPFISFNLEKANWTAEDPRAQYLVDINNHNQTLTEELRNKLVDKCLPHITELLSMGKCTFSRKEQPVVIVGQTLIKNITSRLNCRAYGHYPKNISLRWYKNGQPVPESLMERVTLPFPDITYLTQLSMNITPKKDDVYFCSVDHSSLMSPLIVDWRLSRKSTEVSPGISSGVVIAICLAVILLLVLVVFGSVSLTKSRRQRLLNTE
ncbi:HLA class I histocompatibility antigen, alpha chain F-like [Lithobates pipiens]